MAVIGQAMQGFFFFLEKQKIWGLWTRKWTRKSVGHPSRNVEDSAMDNLNSGTQVQEVSQS